MRQGNQAHTEAGKPGNRGVATVPGAVVLDFSGAPSVTALLNI